MFKTVWGENRKNWVGEEKSAVTVDMIGKEDEDQNSHNPRKVSEDQSASRVLKGSNQSALTVVSVFWVFQLCSIISSTHQDGAERNG